MVRLQRSQRCRDVLINILKVRSIPIRKLLGIETNFSMESIEQTFNGSADWGKKVTCTVSRNGDLIHRVYLRVELPSVTVPAAASSSAYTGFRWLNWLGHILIKNVEIKSNIGLEKHLTPMVLCAA